MTMYRFLGDLFIKSGFVHHVRMFSDGGNERREIKRGGTSRDLLCVVHSKSRKNTHAKDDKRYSEQSPAIHCKDLGKKFIPYIIFFFNEHYIYI